MASRSLPKPAPAVRSLMGDRVDSRFDAIYDRFHHGVRALRAAHDDRVRDELNVYLERVGHATAAIEAAFSDLGKWVDGVADAPEAREALKGYLRDQARRAMELAGLLEMLDQQIDEDDGVLAIAVRETRALEDALDPISIERSLPGVGLIDGRADHRRPELRPEGGHQ